MKDCLIIGNKNAVVSTYVFPLFKDKVLRIGYTIPKDYDQPPENEPKSLNGLTRWITTLQTGNKPPLKLTATYDPTKYPKYDNYDAIEVGRLKDIPYDYQGVMGVPLSFLKYYPELDYEIIEKKGGLKVDGKTKFIRLIIRRNEK